MGIRRKPEETPVTLAAKRSYLGRVYLDWAKYPVVETEEIESGYIVRFRDLRYYDPNSSRRDLLGASVELDRSLNVVRESFGSRRQRECRWSGTTRVACESVVRGERQRHTGHA